ncbi:SAP30-binding protein-like [Pollicipes pollicipes]|uniref:SAP30-binding protein-like n=1 Tax=Pollicipes pollicipes TaxID=41117 RepID=UPI0018850364|nr:SAP30-binding protein-like [Pollicipes pollicipes]XP_037073058.1 SAP30-binding protein-like [Pollicipes pollicipes]
MSALNSLSAQYTDSEGEDDSHDRPTRVSREEPKEEEVQQIEENSNSNFDRPARLVSYVGDPEDDLDLDDELEAGSDDMDISRSDDEGGEQEGERDGAAGAAAASEDLIPSEPAGRCSKDLQEMVAKLCQERERTGADMNDRLRSHKDFRNPSIYEKLITFCDIDEFGTNYPPELYDPSIWGKQSYYDDLARVQKEDMERREKERKERTKVEVVTGTKKLDGEPKRRSKWDQVGAPHGSSVPIIKPAGLATGLPPPAKTIPAFGSIAKKK